MFLSVFFFSSRRRHTRLTCDWSSDVCSSDLEKGTLKVSVMGYDFIPDKGEPIHRDVVYELEQYPEDKTEEKLEKHVAPAIRRHWVNFLQAVDSRSKRSEERRVGKEWRSRWAA